MDRLTRPDVDADQSAVRFMGDEVKVQDIGDNLLHLILNGPTINSINKETLRHLVRQLYSELKRYEDAEEQGRLWVAPCKMDDPLYMVVTKRPKLNWPEFSFIKATYLTENNFFRAIRDFGKTVFMTRQEANDALKKVKGE